MDLGLQDLEERADLTESVHTSFDHQVVNGLRIFVAGPHNPLELETGLDEKLSLITKHVLE